MRFVFLFYAEYDNVKNIPAERKDLSSFIYTRSKETVFHVELKYFLTDGNKQNESYI